MDEVSLAISIIGIVALLYLVSFSLLNRIYRGVLGVIVGSFNICSSFSFYNRFIQGILPDLSGEDISLIIFGILLSITGIHEGINMILNKQQKFKYFRIALMIMEKNLKFTLIFVCMMIIGWVIFLVITSSSYLILLDLDALFLEEF